MSCVAFHFIHKILTPHGSSGNLRIGLPRPGESPSGTKSQMAADLHELQVQNKLAIDLAVEVNDRTRTFGDELIDEAVVVLDAFSVHSTA